MNVKEVVMLIPDKIILYKQVSGNTDLFFVDLFKGKSSDIPDDMADMEIRSIGAARKGIVDICLK